MTNLILSALITLVFILLPTVQLRKLRTDMCSNPKFNAEAKLAIQRVLLVEATAGLVIVALVLGSTSLVVLHYTPVEFQALVLTGQAILNQLAVHFAYVPTYKILTSKLEKIAYDEAESQVKEEFDLK